jgi:mitochondrial fission process protein 1
MQLFNTRPPFWPFASAPESTDTSIRYAAYAARARTILLAARRYIAYTSDIGESFRPVAHPNLVRGAYAISWAYIAGDVSHEGYKAYLRQQRLMHPQGPGVMARGVNDATDGVGKGTEGQIDEAVEIPKPRRVPAVEDYRVVMLQRAVFQSIASMGLPAFTIHSIVKYSGLAMKDIKNVRLRTWGPIGVSVSDQFCHGIHLVKANAKTSPAWSRRRSSATILVR